MARLGLVKNPQPRGALIPRECRTYRFHEVRAATRFFKEGIRKPNFITENLCPFHHLHLNEASGVFRAEQELKSVHELHFTSRRDVLFIGHILQSGEQLIHEPPLAVVQNEVADGLLLVGREPFVGRDMAVNMPWVEVLVGVNHQSMVLRAKRISLFSTEIEIQHREKTFVFRSAEWTGGFGAVVESIPLLSTVRI